MVNFAGPLTKSSSELNETSKKDVEINIEKERLVNFLLDKFQNIDKN